jgi:hypothetical protein
MRPWRFLPPGDTDAAQRPSCPPVHLARARPARRAGRGVAAHHRLAPAVRDHGGAAHPRARPPRSARDDAGGVRLAGALRAHRRERRGLDAAGGRRRGPVPRGGGAAHRQPPARAEADGARGGRPVRQPDLQPRPHPQHRRGRRHQPQHHAAAAPAAGVQTPREHRRVRPRRSQRARALRGRRHREPGRHAVPRAALSAERRVALLAHHGRGLCPQAADAHREGGGRCETPSCACLASSFTRRDC